jgi:hypothetical protein
VRHQADPDREAFMRRIITLGLLALLTAGLFTGCTSVDFADPLHPQTGRPTDYQP